VIRAIGAFALAVARLSGALLLVLGRTLLHLPKLDRRELARSIVLFGYRSLPLALLAAMLIGSTVVLQAGVYAVKFGARLYTGWAAGYALTREFGPLLLGLVMAARIGARNAAELALLNVNGQIEGLRGISLDPFRILVAPRVVGSAVAITALGSVTFLVAVIFEAVSSYFSLKLPLRVFFTAYEDMLRTGDLLGGLDRKSVV
jgi:phospholipid/cholesterol/gamma-HCH transport system permease protein